MKKLISPFLLVLFILLSVINAAAVGLEPGLIVDNKVKTDDSFTVAITLSGNASISACVFTLCYDPAVMEFSSAQLSGSVAGDLEYNDLGGVVKLVFLSTQGVQLSSETSLIEAKFKSGVIECEANLIIYVEQAVSSGESRIDCSTGREYLLAIQENIDGEVARASGAAVSSQSTSSRISSENSASSDAGGVSVYNGSIITEEGEYMSAAADFASEDSDSSFGASNTASDNTLFICGFVAAVCLACAAGGIYLFAKKRAELKLAFQNNADDLSNKDEQLSYESEKSPDQAPASDLPENEAENTEE